MIITSIVTYKTNKEELKAVIECASNSIIDRIYIIDNSPSNELENYSISLSKKVEYIFMGSNLGYGHGHNVALRKAIENNSKYHIVLNSDILFKADVISKLFEYMESHKQVGAIMPKVFYPDGRLQFLCKMQVNPYDFFVRRFCPLKSVRDKRNYYYELHKSNYNQIMNVPCLSGCFMFLRISAIEEVGLFDERYFMYCEDYDLYKRLHQKYKTIFYPFVSIIHAHKKESATNYKMLRTHLLSSIKYFNKWGWFFDKDRKKANNEMTKFLDSL